MSLTLLGLFNAISPKDSGTSKIAADIAFGTLPRQKLDIYAPSGTSGPLPVVFFIYGGSWSDGDRHNYDFAGHGLASLGYVVVVADYRLLPEVEYPSFLQDCAAAFAWVVDHIGDHGGDARRIVLAGHSAGAYNAMMLALDSVYLRRPGLLDRVRAIVGLSGPYDFFPFDGRISLRTFGAVEEPRLTQPINLVVPGLPPTFLGTGSKDGLVGPRNTVALAQKLRDAGGLVVEKHYAGLAHPTPLLALGRLLRRRAPVLADIGEFLGKHV